MSDGPFKHLRLSSRWKRFAAAACNDAVDSTELGALANDALVHEILTDDNQALLRDLAAYARGRQLDLDPQPTVDTIFGSHPKTAFSDILQREMAFRLADHMTPAAASETAVEAAFHDHTCKARTHIQEECIRALECGELTQDQYDCTLTQANATFDSLAESDICDALRAGDRTAFKDDVSRRIGLDDGPNL